MAGDTNEGHGTPQPLDRGHPMPRRASPDKSVTLQHHRLAREASNRALTAHQQYHASLPRRNSSGESQETDRSSKKWFDRSNRNAAGTYDASAMDLDPPFFQKETESSLGDGMRDGVFSFRQDGLQPPAINQTVTRSSSADEFRGVIDDLTIENKRLKEELRKFKEHGPAFLRKDKLFEIKVHGLPKRKKRELEATLRDFAASLESSSESPSQRDRSGTEGKNTMYSSGESRSKHASSSSSHSRPVDSAYASMSTGPSSHGPQSVGRSLGRPSAVSRAKSSEQKVESYLRDTPDGLLPRHTIMTDKDRKKLVVRRLEQLFTGKISGRNLYGNKSMSALDAPAAASTLAEQVTMGPPRNHEASREARIEPLVPTQKKSRSRDNESTSNSNGDQAEIGGNGTGSGEGYGNGGHGGASTSPTVSPPEQRPTRPRDLDPDRLQIPSENMEYIRHLGQVPPEFLPDMQASYLDVSPDADGWVYLNLLCNLAQLHIFNVTPGFIRAAVSEKSKKFQLSPDGRKIRWRGGVDGTKFSSDSSGDNSRSPSTDDTDGSNEDGQRKRQKTAQLATSATASKGSKFGPQISSSSDPFHYKPLFVHRNSTAETSVEDTGSLPSEVAADESNADSGSGSKRRPGGAIIYYSGAPFCTDLAGDSGDVSPTTYMTSTGQEVDSSLDSVPRLSMQRTLSGSSLAYRPLSEARLVIPDLTVAAMDVDDAPPELISGGEDSPSYEDMEFPWCENPCAVQRNPVGPPLEASGLFKLQPDDHFTVVVTTRRPVKHTLDKAAGFPSRSKSEDIAEAIASRLESMRTSSPLPPRNTTGEFWPIHIEYLKADLQKLDPVPLPPPAMFFPPFSTDSESYDDEEIDTSELDPDDDGLVSVGLISQRANPYLSDNTFPDVGNAISDESDDVGMDRSSDDPVFADGLGVDADELQQHSSSSPGRRIITASAGKRIHTGSSVATAGGAESGYSSSMEDDAS